MATAHFHQLVPLVKYKRLDVKIVGATEIRDLFEKKPSRVTRKNYEVSLYVLHLLFI